MGQLPFGAEVVIRRFRPEKIRMESCGKSMQIKSAGSGEGRQTSGNARYGLSALELLGPSLTNDGLECYLAGWVGNVARETREMASFGWKSSLLPCLEVADPPALDIRW